MQFKASDHSRPIARAIILRKAINRSPAHKNRSKRQRIKSNCSFAIHIFWIAKFPIQSSFVKNVKYDRACNICLRYRSVFVIGCSRYCLRPIKFKVAFIFAGLKKKIVQFWWCMWGHFFGQIMDINTKRKIAHLSYLRRAFFLSPRIWNRKHWVKTCVTSAF